MYFIFLDVFPETRSYSTTPYKGLPKSNTLRFATWGLQNRENLLKSALLFSNPSSIFVSQVYLNPRITSANLLYLHIQKTSILFENIFLSLCHTSHISLVLPIRTFFFCDFRHPRIDSEYRVQPFEDYEGSNNGRRNKQGRKLFR